MKKTIKYSILFICMVILTTSCKKDFLNTEPLTAFSDIAVWSDPILIQTFIDGIYSNLNNPANGGDGVLKGEFVDEMHDQWYSFYDFNNSLLTPDNNNAQWFHENWARLYKNIRACNIFFDKIDGVTKFDNTLTNGVLLKNRMKGEVHFLRGYLYFQLVSLYGGVPLVKAALGLNDDVNLPRNRYDDCIKFIVDECDSAAALLPLVQSGKNQGRVTKGATLTLKTRVLLSAASDLYNTKVFPGYAHPELIGYVGGDRTARWQAAKAAARAVIDLGVYKLYKEVPEPGDSIAQNYADIFLKDGTEEGIWVRYYKTTPLSFQSGLSLLSLVAGPNGWHLYGEDTPVGELVDDYEISDGSSFNWSDPTKATQPYKKREPRFYASILYEGAKSRPRPIDIQPLDPEGVVQAGKWEQCDNSTKSMYEKFGLDTRESPVEGFNAGYTGYYLRKFLNPAVDGQYSTDGTPWCYMRYAELLLNYAEACIELNQDAEARTYINMIRTRAGIPLVTESGVALRDRYRHERRIEFFGEENRFFDVRRWVIGPKAYQQFSGVKIVYRLKPDHTTATIPEITPFLLQDCNWLNQAYFFPITRDELNKNNKLVQNPDYN